MIDYEALIKAFDNVNYAFFDSAETVEGSITINVSATNEIGAGTRAAYFGDGVTYLVGGANQSLGFPLTGGIIATTDYVDNEIGTAITNVLNANYS